MSGQTLVVDSTTKSFGTVAPGEPITVSFELVNRGHESIRIVGSEANCTCIVPGDFPISVNRGERHVIRIAVNNPYLEGNNVSRHVNAQVSLLTTNVSQAQIPLTIKGEIRGEPSRPIPPRR
jgi:Protein of unknown function (DUF1573)